MSSPDKLVLSPQHLCHVVLRTIPEKLPKMVEFYRIALGAHVVWENPSLCFLTYDDEHHRIAVTGRPGTSPRVGDAVSSSGLAHIAFSYNTLQDLLLSYKQRKSLSILPSWCVNHGPSMSIYYTDPDGNEIETQADNFATPDEATSFMNSPEFQENPMGVDFDPEDLIRRLENGEDEATLRKRPVIGPRLTR